MVNELNKLKVLFIGTYVPKECGIATFTHDLLTCVSNKNVKCEVIAINDSGETYNYPDEVVFQIDREIIDDYYLAADYINQSDADVVCLQHEFGLFGGDAGNYIFTLLSRINKPVITTMHTIIREPEPHYRVATEKLIAHSEKLIVMSQMSVDILMNVYDVPEDKIKIIFHGMPDYPFNSSSKYRQKMNLSGSPLILTFGLLSENKGIESMLRSLPDVVKQYPKTVYIVLGATHPIIKKRQGEVYRESLQKMVVDLGLENNVVFHNKFVEIEELCNYIMASDIYVSPYLSKEQIVSGTLTYALGMGKAVISTPYWYAQEMLADNRGLLVDFNDTGGFTKAILSLIENPQECKIIRQNAYDFGRKMTWKNVGVEYNDVFGKAAEQYISGYNMHDRFNFIPVQLPEVNINHLKSLTDGVSIMQHTNYSVPSRHHGYSIDDASRALVALTQLIDSDEKVCEYRQLLMTYMSFIGHAQLENGRFHNFMSYEREFIDEDGGDDTLGRCIYGLGHIVGCIYLSSNIRMFARTIIGKSKSAIESMNSPRAKAYAMCGLYEMLKAPIDISDFVSGSYKYNNSIKYTEAIADKHDIAKIFVSHADSLVHLYDVVHKDDWHWFESYVTYGNAKLCEALLLAYDYTKNKVYKKVGLKTLDFLTEIQWQNDYFDIIGNHGWYSYHGKRAIFDQQPIDAGYLAQAYILAYRLTREKKYVDFARYAFEYFLGRNRLIAVMYDYATGAVYDGLSIEGMSLNQGAEPIVCYLMALGAISECIDETYRIISEASCKITSIQTNSENL